MELKSNKEKEFLFGKMERNMKGGGEIMKGMEKGAKSIYLVILMRGSTRMVSLMDLDNSIG